MSTVKRRLVRNTSSGSSAVFSTYHLETDSDAVLMSYPNGAISTTTLTSKIADLDAARTITLAGDVTGSGNLATNASLTITASVTDDSHGHTGSTITLGTSSRAVVTNGSKHLTVSDTTATELGYVHGVTSAIQTQLDNKAASNHNHDSVYVKQTSIGANNGVAPLNASGVIDSTYLPGYVDDIIEAYIRAGATALSSTWLSKTSGGEALTPETGKIYVVLSSGDYQNHTYRWGGSSYVLISASLTLGTTSSTAYYGDKGKTAYDHSQSTHARTDASAVTESTTNGNLKVNGTDITVYSHPTTSGNKHIPEGGYSGNILWWQSDGTATWGSPPSINIAGTKTGDTGNAVTGLEVTGHSITMRKESTFLTEHPPITLKTDDTASASPAFGGNFTALSDVERDTNGHVLKATTKTIMIPTETTLSVTGVKTGDDGNVVTGVEVSNHAITLRKESTAVLEGDSRLTDARTPKSHTHGNITNDGKITSDTAAANGDKIILSDSSASGKLIRSGITLDGTTTTKALTPKGTWETFLQKHQDISGKADVATTVTDVGYNTTDKTITKTINGTTTDVVSAATLMGDMAVMGGANASAAGTKGLVPAPAKGDQDKFLKADGTWADPDTDTNTTYSFSGGTNKFTVTPSDATAYDVSVTPSLMVNAAVSNASGTDVTLSGTDGTNKVTYSATHKTYHSTDPGAKGPSAAASPGFGGSFNVPQVDVNKTGHVSAIAQYAITLPTETQLSETTSGDGNAITSISVSNHAITATKDKTFVEEGDSRLSDARTPISHAHGNITNAGAIGTTADLAAITGEDGVLTTANLYTAAPTASGTATGFITSVSQDSKGKITASKASLPTASSSVAGIAKVGASGGAAAYSHAHGNITSGGALQTSDVAIANGDKLVITDASNSNKVARTSTSFDGTTTTKALTPKGTFETFLQKHQDISGKADVATTVTAVSWDDTNKKVTRTINGAAADVVTFAAGENITLGASDGTLTISSSYTNTDTKVNVTEGETTKAYLLGTPTAPTATAAAVESVADTGVYLGTTAGVLHATTFEGSGSSINVGTTSGNAVYTTTSGKLTSGSLATSDPTADGTALSFIATASQDSKGKITVTKKTIADMVGADGTDTGVHGLVPAPAATDNTKYLRGDGSWAMPTNTDTKVNVTSSTTKSYLLGTTTSPASTAAAVESTANTKVYATDGTLHAMTFEGSGTSINVGSTSGNAVYTTTNGKLTSGSLATADPESSGTATSFIATVSQDAKGKITVTKAAVPTATNTVAGIATLGASGGAAEYDHGHGGITNDGKLGTASRIVVTDSTKKVTVGTINPTDLVVTTDPRLSDARIPTSHTHGNITNGGALQTSDVTIANGDKLVVTDASDGSKIARASVSFDGSTTTKALTPKGTFETFLQSHQDISGKADVATTVTDVAWNDANKKLTKTINGTTTDIFNIAAGDNVIITSENGTATISSSFTNTDTKVNMTKGETTKAYILGTPTTPGATAAAVESLADSGVYLTPTAGMLHATTFEGSGSSINVGTTSGNAVYTTTSGKLTSGSLSTSDPTASGTGVDYIATISQDAKGKITATKSTVRTYAGASSTADGTTGLVPAGPSTGYNTKYLRADGSWETPVDTKVNVKLATTTKAYLLGTSTTPTATSAAVESLADTGVYLTPTAGVLHATTFEGSGSSINVGTTSGNAVYTTTNGKLTSGSLSTSDPTASGTATSFIATASQDAKGKITVTKANLPTATDEVAGITTLGASGGAATYEHAHGSVTNDGKVGTSANLALVTGTGGAITTADLTTTTPTASGNATSFITSVSQDSKGKITASKSTIPSASDTTAGITKLGASGGAATYGHTHGNITNDGKIGSASGLAVVTGTDGALTTSDLTVSDPTAEGTELSFIATASQGADGKISITKNTVADFVGATSTTAGTHGLVPTSPNAGYNTRYLRADGSWAVPTNTDTKVNVKLATTTKAYLLATSTAPTSSDKAVTSVADTGVYLDTAAGSLHATTLNASTITLTGSQTKNKVLAAPNSADGAPSFRLLEPTDIPDLSATYQPVGDYVTTAMMGVNSGVATLDATGKVPSTQLPSFVDDVIEGYLYNNKFYKEAAHTTEIPAESGKIYVDLPTNKTYRWSGSTYTQIKGDLVLGVGATDAYYGDKGQIAYDHSQNTKVHVPTTTAAGKILKSAANAAPTWGDETTLSLSNTSGTGNAITGLSVNGHTITPTMDKTFLTGLTPTTTNVGSASTGTAFTVKGVSVFSGGSAATLTTNTYTIPNVTSAGNAPSLTTNTYTIPNVTSAGSAASLTTSSYTIKGVNEFSAGSVPSLTTDDYAIKGVNAWSAGTAASLSTSSYDVYSITAVGSLTTNTYTIPNVTSAGSAPSLTTNTYTIKSVNTFSAGSVPSLTNDTMTIKGVNVFSAGSAPSLSTSSYDVYSITDVGGLTTDTINIPNVTSAGTAPSLTTTSYTIKGVNEFSAGTAPSLTTSTYTVKSINAWSAGTKPSLTTSTYTVKGVNVFTGPSLTTSTYTTHKTTASVANGKLTMCVADEHTIAGVNVFTAGSLTTSSYTIKGVNVFSDGSLPSLTNDEYTIVGVNVFSAGTNPSLTTSTYTVKGVNAWSAGSATTLGDDIVVTSVNAFTPPTKGSKQTIKGVSVWSAGSVASLTTNTYTVKSINMWSAGTAPSLTTDEVTITGVNTWDAGSAATLGTAFTVKGVNVFTAPTKGSKQTIKGVNVWSAGTVPSLTTDEFAVKSVNVWSAGSAPSLTTSTYTVKGVNVFTAGSAPTLGTAFTVKGVNAWDAGDAATLGTAFTVKGVNAFSGGSAASLTTSTYTIPNISVDTVEVLTAVSGSIT